MPSRFRKDFPDTEGEDRGGVTPLDNNRRESHSRVQTRSSDTCPQECHVMKQNVQGITGEDKLDKTIDLMITRGIHGYFLQGIWLLRTSSRTIRGHLLLHHGMAKKPCHRVWSSRVVAIIIGPALLRAWEMAGKPPPITSASNSDFPGQMIGVTLCFSNRSNKKADTYHKRDKGRINIFLASIYHPLYHDDQNRFNQELESFYNTIPWNAKILAGQDVNSNIGVRSNIFRDVIGPIGINNRNAKGKDLLFLINSIKFRVLLTYFRQDNYTTWWSFNSTRYPHMLDKFICSQPLFRRVKDCKLVYIGMRSNHTTIPTSFKLTAIKFKLNDKLVVHIDWKLIG